MKSLISLKNQTIALRRQEKTYSEIQQILGKKVPKSTLSHWCRHISLPSRYVDRVKKMVSEGASKGRAVALVVKKEQRERYLDNLKYRNKYLPERLKDKIVAKLVLTVLYMTEGAKNQRGSLMFGNSDPAIVRFFLKLLRSCYSIDEAKFRCTLQCRADQKIKDLELFWSKNTHIPLNQFYKARVDPRTIDRPSKKPDYKGVCRIDYFSANIYNELKIVSGLLSNF